MPKFHLQRPFFWRVLDISRQGSPVGDFHCNSGHFSISPLARYNHLVVKTLAHENFSLACGCYLNLVLFEATEVVCFSDRIFSIPMFYIMKS